MVPGMLQKFHGCDPNFNTGDSGANVVWDYSALKYDQNKLITSIILAHNDTTIPGANVDMVYLGVSSLVDSQHTYLHVNNNHTYQVAIKGNSNASIYDNTLLLGIHNIKYGDTVVDSFTRKDLGYGYTIIIADGYGKLILPNGIYNNVLRVRTVQFFDDTTKSNILDDYRTTYRWYDANHTSHLLYRSYSYNGLYPYGYFLAYETRLNVDDLIFKTEYNASLLADKLLLKGQWEHNLQYSLSLINYLGQSLYNSNFTPQNETVEFMMNNSLPRGAYIINIVDSHGHVSRKKLVRH